MITFDHDPHKKPSLILGYFSLRIGNNRLDIMISPKWAKFTNNIFESDFINISLR